MEKGQQEEIVHSGIAELWSAGCNHGHVRIDVTAQQGRKKKGIFVNGHSLRDKTFNGKKLSLHTTQHNGTACYVLRGQAAQDLFNKLP